MVISISGCSFMESVGEMIDPGRRTINMALEKAALTVSNTNDTLGHLKNLGYVFRDTQSVIWEVRWSNG